MNEIKVQTLPVGLMQANAYLLILPGREDAVVIDPGGDAESIRQALQGRRVALVVLTHGHFDHIGAVGGLNAASIAIHERDAAMLTEPGLNLSTMAGMRDVQPPADRLLKDGDVIAAAGMTLTVVHTPGHTPGSICLLCGDHLFTGDTMFARGGYGRVDFPGGDMGAMQRSLARLSALPGNPSVYPGHDDASTLEAERGHWHWS